MHSFEELIKIYSERFNRQHFPDKPFNLYEPAEYFLGIGGKRIRPIACLMANELFSDIQADTWYAADAIEMFHNFTLLHDDVMDNSDKRRGKPTVHIRNDVNTAILSGDAMLIYAYDYLNKISKEKLSTVLSIFNKTALEVCEGQQYDMDFEKRENVNMNEYLKMITLKTSVLLACSLYVGSYLGGATEYSARHLYEFGKNLGIAFQIQDDFLDCYGNFDKFGKPIGKDIRNNKKTFLLIKSFENADSVLKQKLTTLLGYNGDDKVEKVLNIYEETGAKKWTENLKKTYTDKALQSLEKVAVMEYRKNALKELTAFLLQREY